MSKIADKLLVVAVLLILLTLAYIVIGCNYSVYVEQECLKAGYSESKTTIGIRTTVGFDAYCLSRIDATKIIVPFEEIK